jgi:ribosome-associated toxin RatA of RatAB toxin-antitoxin module
MRSVLGPFWYRSLLLAGTLFATALSAQEPAPEVVFSASREGESVTVFGAVELPVEPRVAWSVLTDYEGYPRFISQLRESRIVARNETGVVLEQRGEFGILFLSQTIRSRLLVTEQAPRAVLARAIEGPLRDFQGVYELEPVPHGVRLVYRGRFVPEFHLPPFIGMAALRYALRRNFQEMTLEILARAQRQG